MAPLCYVVDDDQDARENLRDILELEGYEVLDAGSADELFQLPKWDRVAVILLDRKLPDGSPDELLPALHSRAPHAGVIVVTGYSDLEGAVSCLRGGARDYIIKPVSPAALLAAVAREIERQQTVESLDRIERRHHALFQNSMDGFFILDSSWRVLECNPAASEKLGLDTKEVIGKRLSELGSIEGELNLPAVDRSQVRLANEFKFVRKDGTAIHVEYRLVTNFSPGLQLFSFHDVTARKRAEEQVKQSERLAAIGETMTALAHESRNALQRSLTCLEILESHVQDEAAALDLVKRTKKAQEHLRHLYEEVRQWAAPISLCRKSVDLRETWREAWQYAVQSRAGQRPKLIETIDDSSTCNVDEFVMGQVFHNIFENAIEVSPAGSSVYLRCGLVQTNGQRFLRVSVRDEGPGLSPEQQARIFEPFFTTKTRGTGLGMALCARIIEAHGGAITARSPGGAEIEFELPV